MPADSPAAGAKPEKDAGKRALEQKARFCRQAEAAPEAGIKILFFYFLFRDAPGIRGFLLSF